MERWRASSLKVSIATHAHVKVPPTCAFGVENSQLLEHGHIGRCSKHVITFDKQQCSERTHGLFNTENASRLDDSLGAP